MKITKVTMNQKIEKLISGLQQSLAGYEEMLELIGHERKAALEGKVETIHRQAHEKEALVASLKAFEKDREMVLQELSVLFNCPQSDLTLGYLARRVEPGYGKKLNDLHANLQALLPKVRKANEENQIYINHILGIVKNGLRFFERTCSSMHVYGASGVIDGVHANHGLILSNTV